jgi:hypothetical protein
MFKPVRVVATLVLLGSIAMTFMGAFLLNNAVLCLVMVIVEYLAYIWYSLSYIPYARSVSLRFLYWIEREWEVGEEWWWCSRAHSFVFVVSCVVWIARQEPPALFPTLRVTTLNTQDAWENANRTDAGH